jgi:hypothetical protein
MLLTLETARAQMKVSLDTDQEFKAELVGIDPTVIYADGGQYHLALVSVIKSDKYRRASQVWVRLESLVSQ